MRKRSDTGGIGGMLVEAGRLSADQLDESLAEQSETRERIGEILVRRGFVSEGDLLEVLSDQLGFRTFDPAQDGIEPTALELISLDFARRYRVLPVRIKGEALQVATADPLDVEAQDHLRRIANRAGKELELLLAPADLIERKREKSYGLIEGNRNVTALIGKVVDEYGEHEASDDGDVATRKFVHDSTG